jgi:hypothetical protein
MPPSIQYRPKTCITRHKILCPGSSKMCLVTRHILVGQLGSQGKEPEGHSISLINWLSIFIDFKLFEQRPWYPPPISNISGFWQWSVSVRSLLILKFVDYSLLLGGCKVQFFGNLTRWRQFFFFFLLTLLRIIYNVQYWSHAQ